MKRHVLIVNENQIDVRKAQALVEHDSLLKALSNKEVTYDHKQ